MLSRKQMFVYVLATLVTAFFWFVAFAVQGANLVVEIPANCSASASVVTVTCVSEPVKPPIPPDTATCPTGTPIVDVPWGTPPTGEGGYERSKNPVYTPYHGGFKSNGMFVLRYVAPTTIPTLYQGTTQIAEWQGMPTFRFMTLSRSACDFRPVDPTGANGPVRHGRGNTASVVWSAGPAANTIIKPGETWYVSVCNALPGAPCQTQAKVGACTSDYCNALLTTNWPYVPPSR